MIGNDILRENFTAMVTQLVEPAPKVPLVNGVQFAIGKDTSVLVRIS